MLQMEDRLDKLLCVFRQSVLLFTLERCFILLLWNRRQIYITMLPVLTTSVWSGLNLVDLVHRKWKPKRHFLIEIEAKVVAAFCFQKPINVRHFKNRDSVLCNFCLNVPVYLRCLYSLAWCWFVHLLASICVIR